MLKIKWNPLYIFYILMLLHTLYFAQGVLYTGGSIISKTFLILITGISFFYFIKSLSIKKAKGSFFNLWTTLLVLNILSFILTGKYTDFNHFNMFQFIFTGMLPFYPAFYLSSKNHITEKHIVLFLFFLIPVDILKFFYTELTLLADLTRDKTTVNYAYSFAMLVPYIFFIKNKKIAYAVIVIIIFFLMQGAKRGALFAGLAGISIYVYYQLRYGVNRYKILNYLQVAIALVFIFFAADYFFSKNDYFMGRMQNIAEAKSLSIRFENYIAIWDAWSNTNSIKNLLLGYGFAGSIKLTGGLFAHNDWLEILSNLGLIGIIVYLSTLISGFNLYRKLQNPTIKYALFAILITWLLMSMGSMYYTSVFLFKHAILLGFIAGYYFKLTKSKNNINLLS